MSSTRIVMTSVLALMLTAIPACGDSGGAESTTDSGTNNSGGTSGDGGSTASKASTEAAIEGTRGAIEASFESVSLPLELTALATQLSGSSSLVTWGTIDVQGQTATWSAEPSDRFVLTQPGLPTVELWLTTLQGYLDGEVEDYFANDYALAFRVLVTGTADLTVDVQRVGGSESGSASGTATLEDGQTYDIQLAYTDSVARNVDVSGLDSHHTYTVTVTMSGNGLQLQGTETYVYKAIYVDNFVENQSRDWSYTWSDATGDYAFDAHVFVAFKDAKPTDEDQWSIYGSVTKGGQSWGEVTTREELTEFFVEVSTPDGVFELVTYPLQ